MDSDPDSTDRVPIVLVGPECEGAEAALGDCPGFSLQLEEVGRCRHANDVHVVCSGGPEPGAPAGCKATCMHGHGTYSFTLIAPMGWRFSELLSKHPGRSPPVARHPWYWHRYFKG